jgi:hypothetical protein
MKHIKLFEDYSDEEIEGLLGDLESIGHDYRLIPGKDFGFGKMLDKKNDGTEVLFLSPKVVSLLSNKGFFLNEKPDSQSKIKTLDTSKINTYNNYVQSYYREGIPSLVYIKPISMNLSAWTINKNMDPSMYFVYLKSWNKTNSRFFPSQGYKNEGILGKEKVKKSYDYIVKELEKIKY